MTLFSAYQVIHTWCKQKKPLERSLNFFVETRISNTLSTVKLIRNFPIRALSENFVSALPSGKIILRRKNFGPYLSSLNCVLVSVGVQLCYRMTLQGVWKVEKSDRLRFSPGTCLIIEKRYNIVTQNV